MDLSNLNILLAGVQRTAWQNMVMLGVGGVLIFLAVKYEL